jgi:hypothetical protein
MRMETTKIALGRNRVVSMGSRTLPPPLSSRRAIPPRAHHPLPSFPRAQSPSRARLPASACAPATSASKSRHAALVPPKPSYLPPISRPSIFPQSILSLFRDESTLSAFVNLQARQGKRRRALPPPTASDPLLISFHPF